MLRQTSYSEEALSAAAKTPGSLLLRTTVANLFLEHWPEVDKWNSARHSLSRNSLPTSNGIYIEVGLVHGGSWRWREE
jgi:hypothetical protein